MNQTMKLTPQTHNEFLKSYGLPETVCFAPYMNLDLDQTGSMLTCYRGKTTAGNWKQGETSKQYNHKDFVDIRKDLYEGKSNKNCAVCQNRESKGLHSIRYKFTKDAYNSNIFDQIVENIKKDHTQSNLEDLLFVEIRPHNVCNLECMHCNQVSSSKWASTVKHNPRLKIDYESVFAGHEEIIDNNPYVGVNDPRKLKELFDKAPNIKRVHFTGGEPLLDKTHDEWLQIIPNKKNINLGYHSNLQHKLYTRLFNLWSEFNNVMIYNSWDACERLYPYFRYRGEFKALEHNLNAIKNVCKNVELRGTLTVNLFSLFDFEDHIRLWEYYNMDPHHSFVEHTHPMSVVYLPQPLKEHLIKNAFEKVELIKETTLKEKVKEIIKSIALFADQYKQEQLNTNTSKYILELDSIRKTNILEVCPELKKYIKED